jgi:carbon monoxide dehydrogenase subunit G
MKLEGEHNFNGPREEVWAMFYDPKVLASALPGTQSLNLVDKNTYEGAMFVRVGPVSGEFSGKLVISDEVPPESCTLTVDGKGAPGFAKGVGHVKFAEQSSNLTHMTYEGDLQIGGMLASVGQRMLDSVAKSMIKTAFESLDKALQERVAAKNEGRAAEYKPPTETEFAAAVAKDMGKNIFQIAEVRMVLYVVPLAILFALIGYLLSRGR